MSVVRRCPVLAAAIVICASRGVSAQGMTWDMTTSVTMEPAVGAASAANLVMRGMSNAQGAFRMDIVSSPASSGPNKAGNYLLLLDGRIVSVDPQSKTYVDATKPSQRVAKVDSIANSAVNETADTVSASEMYEGRPSLHVRIVNREPIQMMGRSVTSTMTVDLWFVKLMVPLMLPDADGSVTSGVIGFGTSGSASKRLIRRENGTPVKIVMRQEVDSSSTGAGSPPKMSSTIVMEMKNLKDGPIDAAMLVIPSGFVRIDR